MDNERITAILHIHKKHMMIDVDIPLDITVNELIIGLNQGFQLGMDTGDMSKCYLKTENPIALLKGNKCIAEYGLRNGTTINITE